MMMEFEIQTAADDDYEAVDRNKEIVEEERNVVRRGAISNRNRVVLGSYSKVDWRTSNNPIDTSVKFVLEMSKLEKRGRRAEAFDRLCVHFDDMMYRGGLKRVGVILDRIPIEKVSTPCLVALLTITLPRADEILSRKDFFKKCDSAISTRSDNENGLLKGLE